MIFDYNKCEKINIYNYIHYNTIIHHFKLVQYHPCNGEHVIQEKFVSQALKPALQLWLLRVFKCPIRAVA